MSSLKEILYSTEELFGTLVKIVLARESGIKESDDGEIEIDLEALKTSTLRALKNSSNSVSSLTLFCLFVLLLYVPSQQLRSWRDGQFS